MASVEKPLPFMEIMQNNAKEVMEKVVSLGGNCVVDTKGRYLHWHELKRRIPNSSERLVTWGAIKLARASVLKRLDLVSESGEPFKLFVSDTCQSIIHSVEQLIQTLGSQNSTTTHSENNRYLVKSLMMEEAISSAQLEGAATTRKVAKEMLEKDLAPKNDDERMILNNYLLMQRARFNKDEELSIDLICEFHQIATMGVKDSEVNPGEVRTSDDIFVGGKDDDIAHQPPKAELLNDRLTKLCAFANELHDGQEGRIFIHPIVKAIILHFMLGYEHPFRDGNGRTARCLFYWFLLKKGYWAFEYISISSLLKKAPTQYGESYLFTETDEYDLTYFVVYQLKIIGRAVTEFIEYIEAKKRAYYELMGWLDETGISKKLSYRQVDLLKKVIRNPGRMFYVKEVVHDYDIAEGTARSDLDKLVRLKVLGKVRDGKTYLYIARNDAEANLKTLSTK